MKAKNLVHVLLFLLLLVTGGVAAAQPGAEKADIIVLGRGSVTAEPDIAWVQIGVETFAREVSAATSENSTRLRDVYERLLSLGIEERDMQTTNYNVYFERRYPEPTEQAQTGIEGTYHVVNTLTVTVRDTASLGKYIDEAIAAGANQLWGVQFGVAEPDVQRRQAREKAVLDARQKAEQVAGAAGVRLGQLVRISEVQEPQVGPLARGAMMDSAAATTMAGGELTFTETLELTWKVQ